MNNFIYAEYKQAKTLATQLNGSQLGLYTYIFTITHNLSILNHKIFTYTILLILLQQQPLSRIKTEFVV